MTIAQEKTTEPAPLLTTWQARNITSTHRVTELTQRALEAIASGRVVCIDTQTHVAVAKMTEAEARQRYYRWVGASDTLYGERAWVAALRDLGVIL